MLWALTLVLAIQPADPADGPETLNWPAFPRDAQLRALAATARVRDPAARTTGSAAFVGRSGPHLYLLTAAHVARGPGPVEVAAFTPASHPRPAATYKAAVIARDPDLDLAVLRIATRDDPPAMLRLCPPADAPTGRDWDALATGCATGDFPVLTRLTVAGPVTLKKPGVSAPVLHWQTPRPPTPSRSGEPLADRAGRLLGIASGRGDDKGYYVHPEEIAAFLRRHGLPFLLPDAAGRPPP